MNIFERKTHNILNNFPEITKKQYFELKQKEDAALTICGGLLGNCYLMAEVIESIAIETIDKAKKCKWYKHLVKYNFNKSLKELHKSIVSSTNNSPTNSSYMREVADAIYDLLKDDLFKLKNAIYLELCKYKKLHDKDVIADILLIETLYQYIDIEYQNIIDYMLKIRFAYYDSWYFPAKCEGPHKLWSKGMEMINVGEEVDLNDSQIIKNGIIIINNKMHDNNITEIARNTASQYAEEGVGKQLFEKALDILEK